MLNGQVMEREQQTHPCSCTQKIDEHIGTRTIEFVHSLLPVLATRIAIL